ncbi:MAG TPA: acyl-CoA dehydrogenase family protein [Candidatus Dormibacteraeota bacterium]|nr:acyl-CoA dehydrogenase family protein [Candidatus Dormibacteraeota bacterium]
MVAGRAAAALVAAAARFAAEVLAPSAAARAAGAGGDPRELGRAAGRAGLAGLGIPVASGGAGADRSTLAAVIERLARACASAAVLLDVHLSVAVDPIVAWGTPAQRQHYLPPMAAGEWLGAFALTEPGSGSDAAALRTRARPVAGGYRLDGTKTFITNAGAARVYVVIARTDDASPGGAITAFLVEADTPGLRVGPPLRKLGLRGSPTAELTLEGVELPASARLGPEGEGFRIAMAALDIGRIGIAAQAVGIAAGALDAVLAHRRAAALAGTADPRGPRAPDDLATADVAEMATRIVAARALTAVAAATADAGQPLTRIASMAKLFATDTAMAVTAAAVDWCAPDSAGQDHPAAIRFRDAKATQIYEGTNQVQRLVIARALRAPVGTAGAAPYNPSRPAAGGAGDRERPMGQPTVAEGA